MFKQNEFIEYVEREFSIEGATYRLIANCIEFVKSNHQDDFVSNLFNLLDNTIGIEKREIEMFYKFNEY